MNLLLFISGRMSEYPIVQTLDTAGGEHCNAVVWMGCRLDQIRQLVPSSEPIQKAEDSEFDVLAVVFLKQLPQACCSNIEHVTFQPSCRFLTDLSALVSQSFNKWFYKSARCKLTNGTYRCLAHTTGVGTKIPHKQVSVRSLARFSHSGDRNVNFTDLKYVSVDFGDIRNPSLAKIKTG